MEKTDVRKNCKYSREFKQQVVDRFAAGESALIIARALNIRRKFVYDWRDKGFGSLLIPKAVKRETVGAVDPQQRKIARQQQEIAKLERLAGQQAAQIDFFVAALRAIKETPPNNGAVSGSGSTQRSKA